jgi:hypothetical protein
MVEYKDPERRTGVDKDLYGTLAGHLWVNGLGDNYSVFFLNLPNIPSADEVLERLKRVTGVKAARIEILHERIELYDSLREDLNEKLDEIRGREVQLAAR